MYKTLCIATLFLAAFAFTSGSKSVAALPSGPTSPVIVARGVIQNQTAPFSGTIYTPSQDGLFRLSVYATITTADPNSNSAWDYSFYWTDASGKTYNGSGLLIGSGSQLGEFVPYNAGLGYPQVVPSATFQASKGIPITHTMTISNGPPDNSVYAFYFTLERLE